MIFHLYVLLWLSTSVHTVQCAEVKICNTLLKYIQKLPANFSLSLFECINDQTIVLITVNIALKLIFLSFVKRVVFICLVDDVVITLGIYTLTNGKTPKTIMYNKIVDKIRFQFLQVFLSIQFVFSQGLNFKTKDAIRCYQYKVLIFFM